MACNINGGSNSRVHAKVAAGGTIEAHYEQTVPIPEANYDGTPMVVDLPFLWGHEWGPMTAYLADCKGPCDAVDVNDGVRRWFKVDEGGLLNGTAMSGRWKQRDLVEGLPWSVKIPRRLKPGFYLIRHEVLVVHTVPNQWYVECAQIEVTGSGTEAPAAGELVSFPGAYDPKGKFGLSNSIAARQIFSWAFVLTCARSYL